MVTRSIASAQTQVEAQNFELRKNVLKYDEVMNRQRVVIYEERRKVLEGADLQEQIREFITDTVVGYVHAETAEGYPEDWDLERLWTALRQIYPVSLTADGLIADSGGDVAGLSVDYLSERLREDAQSAYDAREEGLGEPVMRELERRVVLSVLDRKWREHLYEMDYLQEGIGLRAMAQKDPLVEYQREGFLLFNAMMDGIKEESVGYLFNVEVDVDGTAEPGADAQVLTVPATGEHPAVEQSAVEELEPDADLVGFGEAELALVPSVRTPQIKAKGLDPRRPQHLEYSSPSVDGEGGVEHHGDDGPDPVDELSADANRAERRRAERASRKRKR
jgi:preprotein translocase subunit SecA